MTPHNRLKSKTDEVVNKEMTDWEISVSKSKKRLYISAISYHAPKLELSCEDLQELLNTLDENNKA